MPSLANSGQTVIRPRSSRFGGSGYPNEPENRHNTVAAQGQRGGRLRTAVDLLQARVSYRGLELVVGCNTRRLSTLVFAGNAARQPSTYWYRIKRGALPYNLAPLHDVERLFPGSTAWFAHPVWDALRCLEVSPRSPVHRPFSEINTEAFFSQAVDIDLPDIFGPAENATTWVYQRLLLADLQDVRPLIRSGVFRKRVRGHLIAKLQVEPYRPWAAQLVRFLEHSLSLRARACLKCDSIGVLH